MQYMKPTYLDKLIKGLDELKESIENAKKLYIKPEYSLCDPPKLKISLGYVLLIAVGNIAKVELMEKIDNPDMELIDFYNVLKIWIDNIEPVAEDSEDYEKSVSEIFMNMTGKTNEEYQQLKAKNWIKLDMHVSNLKIVEDKDFKAEDIDEYSDELYNDIIMLGEHMNPDTEFTIIQGYNIWCNIKKYKREKVTCIIGFDINKPK